MALNRRVLITNEVQETIESMIRDAGPSPDLRQVLKEVREELNAVAGISRAKLLKQYGVELKPTVDIRLRVSARLVGLVAGGAGQLLEHLRDAVAATRRSSVGR